MGHLTLISEDVIGALDHFPADLRLAVAKYIPQAAWDEYVTGRYIETKKKDSSLLGGGKPVVVPSAPRPGARWRVDEEDTPSPTAETSSSANGILGTRGEFRRATSARPTRETSADFGRAVLAEDEEEQDTSPPQV
jgi:serine/threonine-protein phosphatase 6 regulatory subunit 3